MRTFSVILLICATLCFACGGKKRNDGGLNREKVSEKPDRRERWQHLQPVIQRAINAYHQQDFKQGQKLLLEKKAQIADYSYGQYLLGELSLLKNDYLMAERSYTRALELNDSSDPLPNRATTAWAARHGLGLATAMRGRYRESIPIFKRSLQEAFELPESKYRAVNHYDLACAYAELGNYERAFENLAESIRLDKKFREHARKDESFGVARKRRDFQSLLATQ